MKLRRHYKKALFEHLEHLAKVVVQETEINLVKIENDKRNGWTVTDLKKHKFQTEKEKHAMSKM